ncbi:MAG: bifunctional diguanylate cyclase/phosphodiesterase [Sulfurimonas sp.]|nr:bifunctional diguanylate cyclase/phosphodiesterase [Sulfurimonas sp.]
MNFRARTYITVAFSFILIAATLILSQKSIESNISKLVIIAFLILFTYLVYYIYTLKNSQNILKLHLKEAQAGEKQQENLQKQLLKHNTNLENEISTKTKEIHEKRYTSILTGLPNRSKLLEESSIFKFNKMALLNIDNFQSVNDIYGEEIGNVTLKITAVFLQKQIEDKNLFLYHVGGDEFAIVAKENDDFYKELFVEFIEEVLQKYKDEDFVYREKKLNLMISAGISFSGRKKMLAYADMALKDAKKRNVHISVFDNQELEKIHKIEMESHKKLLHALDNNDIISFFQPIVYLKDDSKPTKYESLVRIKEDNGDFIQPFNFLDVAKTNRIYNKITQAVLTNTLAAAQKYNIPCSLNISLTDIYDETTMQMFFSTLDKYAHNELLTIELLETEDFVNYDDVNKFCKRVHSYGIKIALDDFGSGYSNFAHILNLPIDYIKIDASLISHIGKDKNSRIMVETIVELAHRLEIETIAEYVSSKEILDIIKEIGIDYAQGFYIGKPERIEDLLSA